MRAGRVWASAALLAVVLPWQSAQAPTGLSGVLIVVDPGHGGDDWGAQGFGLGEADVVLDIALHLRDLLAADGADVLMTRDSNVTVSLEARVDLANEEGADRFVFIHANSCDACGHHGTEVYYHDGLASGSTAALFAGVVQDEIAGLIGTDDRGVRTADLFALREAEMPAILVETAFIDHRSDNELLDDPEARQDFARAIFLGIQRHFGVPIPGPGTDLTPPTITITAPDLDVWHPGFVTVRANITDPSGLQFARARIDERLWNWDSSPPHEWRWAAGQLVDGRRDLHIEAQDDVRNRGSLHATLLIDHTPPVIEIVEPKDDDVVLVGTRVRVEAEDATSGVDRVVFHVDGEPRAVDREPPFEWTWDALLEPGFRHLEAEAVDRAGNEQWADVRVLVI